MDVFMYASADTPPDAAAQNFIDIAHLYRIGFLHDESTVWINADAPEAGMWTLTDKSMFVKMFRTVYPGYVRLTRSNARWGRTMRETTSSDSTHILDMREVHGDEDPKAAIVVVHRDASSTVGILADGSRHHLHNGSYEFDPFTVIDINNFKPGAYKTPGPYVSAHAMLNGAAIMSTTAHDGGEFVRENMGLFKTEFGKEHIEFLDNHWNKIEAYAKIQTERLVRNIRNNTTNAEWAAANETF